MTSTRYDHQLLLRAAAAFRRRSPRLAAMLNYPERRHRPWRLQHRASRRRPIAPSIIVPDRRPTDEDVAIAARLLAAFARAMSLGPGVSPIDRPDLWTFNYSHQSTFVSLLEGDDPAALATYLCNVWRQDAAHGIAQGHLEYERICHDPKYRQFSVLTTHDKLVTLAEAVGAEDAENPESWPPMDSYATELDALVVGIGRRIGIDITPPNIDSGLLKLRTSHGLFGERDLYAIYTAYLAREALAGAASLRMCEIGGGSGRATYWACRMGLGPITLVDLPHVNAVQGYYLAKGLGADRVAFYGEDAPADVRVLPNRWVDFATDDRFDLVLNQDSFPEMHPRIVSGYLTWMKGTCPGGLFWSVNHESKATYGSASDPQEHVSVPEAVARVGGFERLQRWPYWLRRGYVAELYRVTG